MTILAQPFDLEPMNLMILLLAMLLWTQISKRFWRFRDIKKFKQYGLMLREKGFTPGFLILRDDNLAAAIGACRAGRWDVNTGNAVFDYIRDHTKFDLKAFLEQRALKFRIERK